jgi:CTP:molybdopterin cytidylyltransferase MocA
MTITALIMASGKSPALGYAKANLCINNQTILEKVTSTAISSGCEALILSIGEENDPLQCSRRDVQSIISSQRSCPVSVSVSPPEQTQVQSIHRAIDMVKPSGRVLLWPIDYPFANVALIRKLIDSFSPEQDNIAIPKLGSHIGYPALLGIESVRRIMQASTSTSLTAFLQDHASKLREVSTVDPRVIMSVNLPEQAAVLGIKSPGQFHQYS